MTMRGYNFSERMRRTLAAAREDATRLGSDYVSPEHILLGILAQDGAGTAVLANLGVTREAVSRDIENRVGPRPRKDAGSNIALPFSSRGKRVLEMAMDEAHRLNHSYVGTEHLLLGILRDPTSEASVILAAYGVTPERARAETERQLGARTEGLGRTDAVAAEGAGAPEKKHARMAMVMSALALIISVAALLLAVTRRP